MRHREREEIPHSIGPDSPQLLTGSTELNALHGVGVQGPGQLAGSRV